MTILITGSSRGIGKALAEKYLDQGHTVYGLSRSNHEDLKDRKNFFHQALDLSDFDGILETVPGFLGGIDRINLMILNAGILNTVKDLRDTTLEEIRKVMDINVWSNKLLIEACFQTVKNIDQVVAISSGASVSGSRGWNAYALSKAALNMLIDLYSKEYVNTHFCALAPGIVDTDMQDYISDLPDAVDYPVVQKLKKAKNTSDMPMPEVAANILINAMKKVRKYESGSFLDVRKI